MSALTGLVGFGLGVGVTLAVRVFLNRRKRRVNHVGKPSHGNQVSNQVSDGDLAYLGLGNIAARTDFGNAGSQGNTQNAGYAVRLQDVLEVNQGGGRAAFFSGQNLNSTWAAKNAASLNGASQIRKDDDEDESPTSPQAAGEGADG